MKITKVLGREILDSRGWPTIQCELILDDAISVISSVPTGLSRSNYEARELRDGGKRLWGMGVIKCVENIENVIAPLLIGQEPHALEMDYKLIDLDGTPDKSHLGANTILAVSMALYKAQACAEDLQLYELIAYLCGNDSVSLPFPFFNMINGGLHAHTNLQIQEFIVVPVGALNFRESVEIGAFAFHELKNMLLKVGKSIGIGDEGGFAPEQMLDYEALDLMTELLERLNTNYENRCVLAIDVASSRFYDPSTKLYFFEGQHFSAAELVGWYHDLIDQYPIFSIEDGLSEDDWSGWQLMTKELSDRIQIAGDDLFATNTTRIETGITENCATAAIIKPNQIGTVLETLQAIKLCKANDINVIISHRSGETEDTFIADLAVGSNAGQIKAGGCSRSERLAKYNRLLAIEDHLMLASENASDFSSGETGSGSDADF